ncbi:hypothetical protein HR45_01250 [Shewanella mangrovi]|uniref:DUF3581 domain-containing protein n=1 Tax=Shewanella mangrovi TaxID=1515746 RepID=A0A094LUY6_9GAMM|nr:DUF3581 domain-containing protein [Shewanella mangrovi]KFZ39053.1 hypothetical protein HR45_01250 [Shewanella mangrovi]
MFLTDYFNKQNNNITITRKQASDFAKNVAGDVNPIHDEDAKRFCVPGDLLFSLVLNEYGLSQHMQFRFEGMVADGVPLHFREASDELIRVEDEQGKAYLQATRGGEKRYCDKQITSFIRSYVAFSGLNFTHAIVPLMQEHQLMINPARPLVIYESMGFELSSLDFEDVELQLVDKVMEVDGKRGDVTLTFKLMSGDTQVGTGCKTLVMSGLRPIDPQAIDEMIAEYSQRAANIG